MKYIKAFEDKRYTETEEERFEKLQNMIKDFGASLEYIGEYNNIIDYIDEETEKIEKQIPKDLKNANLEYIEDYLNYDIHNVVYDKYHSTMILFDNFLFHKFDNKDGFHDSRDVMDELKNAYKGIELDFAMESF